MIILKISKLDRFFISIIIMAILLCCSSQVQAAYGGNGAALPSGGINGIEWEKTFGGNADDSGNSVLQTSDGGYIITGSTKSTVDGFSAVDLIKTDAGGNNVWERNYGKESGYDFSGKSVQQTIDGGYIVVASTESGSNSRIYLLKTDASGGKIWEKFLGDSARYNYMYASKVIKASDGGYVIVGSYQNSGSRMYVYTLKVDAEGNQVWSHFSSAGGSQQDAYSADIQQTSEGGYIITGCVVDYDKSNTYDVLLLKLDSNGERIWYKLFGGDKDDFGSSVRQTDDGGYILAGRTQSFGMGGNDVYIIKTDPNGNKQWEKTLGGTNDDSANSIILDDGGYIIAGQTNSSGLGGSDVYLVKTDGEGNKLWEKTFGGTLTDAASCLQLTKDGGYIIVGFTNSSGNGGRDIYLLKFRLSVKGVTLNKNTMILNKGGKSTTLVATVDPAEASNRNLIWSSSDETVAKVYDGLVTPISTGTAVIKVKTVEGNFSAQCSVTVDPPISVTGIHLDKDSLDLIAEYSTSTLTVYMEPIDATNQGISWSSSEPAIATVDNGKVRAIAIGEATITATSADGRYTTTCNVKVSQPTSRDVTISASQSLGQKGNSAFAGIYEYDNLKIGDNVELTSNGTSQLVIKVKGTLTLGKNATIRVRNGYYKETSANLISSLNETNLSSTGIDAGGYRLYENMFGKGGDGGDGGEGGDGIPYSYSGYWFPGNGGNGGYGGGGGFGGGKGGLGGRYGAEAFVNYKFGKIGKSGLKGGDNGDGGGYGNGIGGPGIDVDAYSPAGGGGGMGNGGRGGNGGHRDDFGDGFGGGGGGGGGYGGGILTIIADQIVYDSVNPPHLLVSGQKGGLGGKNGLDSSEEDGQNGQGGLLLIQTNNYTPSLDQWNLYAKTLGDHTFPSTNGGHGIVVGDPQKVFINGGEVTYSIQQISANKTVLNTSITEANNLLASKAIGTAVGNVSQVAHDAYNSAITNAMTVNNNATVNQAEVNAAVTDLAIATTVFNNDVIPDADNNNTIEMATTIQENTLIKAEIYPVGDMDYYKFVALTSGPYKINCIGDVYFTAVDILDNSKQYLDYSFGAEGSYYNLIAGQTYYVEVLNFGSYGTDVIMTYGLAVAPINGIPRWPSNISATVLFGTEIDLKWRDNSYNETGFTIERKVGIDGTWAELSTVDGVDGISANIHFEDTSLSSNTIYYYRVKAVNATGSSYYSNEIKVAYTDSGEVNKADLTAAITAAQILHDDVTKVEGTIPGQYTLGSKAVLEVTINAAMAVKNDASATQALVDAQVVAIRNATIAFNNSIITADYSATPIVQVGINPNHGESAGIFVGLKDVRNAQGEIIQDVKLADYQIELVYDHDQTKVLDVVDQGTGNFEKIFFVPLAVTGTSNSTTDVLVKFTSLTDINLNQIYIPDIKLTFQRGKILNEANNRTLSLLDAVAGLQYLAKIIDSGTDTGKVNVVNMASILALETGATNIKPSVKDVIALMQKLVGLRDESFQLVSH